MASEALEEDSSVEIRTILHAEELMAQLQGTSGPFFGAYGGGWVFVGMQSDQTGMIFGRRAPLR